MWNVHYTKQRWISWNVLQCVRNIKEKRREHSFLSESKTVSISFIHFQFIIELYVIEKWFSLS